MIFRIKSTLETYRLLMSHLVNALVHDSSSAAASEGFTVVRYLQHRVYCSVFVAVFHSLSVNHRVEYR
jgi:hypothetical protein